MGGKSSPDYGDAAVAQGEANQQVVTNQTYANRPTQYTPWGSTSWNPYQYTDPGSGEQTTRWEQTQSLTPELQDILNKQIAIQGGRSDVAGAMMGRLGTEFGTPMDWRGLNPMGQVPTSQFTLPEGDIGDPNAFRQHGEDMRMAKSKSRLDPMYEGKKSQLEQKMLNQGLTPQDAQWKSQVASLSNQENDAYSQAMFDASAGGMQEANQMWGHMMGQNQNNYDQALGANNQNFNQAMRGSQYANQIRQQQLTEAMQKRGFSLNEINALLSGQQVQAPQMPSFTGAESAQPAPIYQGAVDQGNFDQAQTQQMIDAATAGASMIPSDRRLKTNIQRIGTVRGYPWYSYDYVWGQSSQGVMADEVPAEFVGEIGGYQAVDYDKLLGA